MFHVHDECVIDCPESQADLDAVVKIMTLPIPWALWYVIEDFLIGLSRSIGAHSADVLYFNAIPLFLNDWTG